MLEQVKAWCRNGSVTIRPVVDLNTHLQTDAYAPTEALKAQVWLRDPVCVFPYCATKSRDCDLDHVIAWQAGGKTASDNLAPLCRRHHRAKTHGRWTYRVLTPGTYAWTSPHGYRYLTQGLETTDQGRHPSRP